MCANETIQGFALYTGTLPFSKCRYTTTISPFLSLKLNLDFADFDADGKGNGLSAEDVQNFPYINSGFR